MKSSLAALAFLAVVFTAAAEEPKIKVLLIEGITNHDWKHRSAIVQAILARDGSFAVDLSVTLSTADDPAWAAWRPNFTNYDVVISGYNNLKGGPRWPTEVEAGFEAYIRKGGGFYAWHEANNSFGSWPEYNKILGLGWRGQNYGTAIVVRPDESLELIPPGAGKGTGHGARVDVTVKRFGNHPIHQGLPASWMAADIEIYRYARGPAENLTVLSYALDPGTQLQFPVEWVVKYGEGHAYMTSYGHVWADQPEPKGTRCAAFQTIFVRALKWLARKDPGTTAPADFPAPTAISLRPYESAAPVP